MGLGMNTSFGKTSLAIIIPSLAVAWVQGCATAEELDRETLALIEQGQLVGGGGTGTTTHPTDTPTGTAPPSFPTSTVTPTTDPTATQPAPGDTTQAPVNPAPPATVPGSGGTAPEPTPTAPAPTLTGAEPGAGGAPGVDEPEPSGMAGTDGMGSGATGPLDDADAGTPVPTDPVPDVPQEILDATDMRLHYQSSSSDGTISFRFWIGNFSAEQAPRLDEITVRYWYTSDDVPFALTFDHKGDWVKDATAEYGTTSDGREYIEFAYPSTARVQRPTMESHTTLQIRMPQIYTPPTPYVQSDDWSFSATAMISQTYENMTIYRRGALVWGEEPPVQ